MKGHLLSHHAHATIVDISHEITPHDIYQGGACIARAYRQFPPGSIHLVVVDPGVGSPRHALVVDTDEHWFVAPDNGVLSQIIKSRPHSQAYRLKSQSPWWRKSASFDGLSLFAPAAAEIARGRAISELAMPINDLVIVETPELRVDRIGNELRCQIIGFDRFGNALTNLTLQTYEKIKLKETKIYLRTESLPLCGFYEESDTARPFGIFNSDDALEIALFQRSARQILNLNLGDDIILKPIQASNNTSIHSN